jgi:hypothetical protein
MFARRELADGLSDSHYLGWLHSLVVRFDDINARKVSIQKISQFPHDLQSVRHKSKFASGRGAGYSSGKHYDRSKGD